MTIITQKDQLKEKILSNYKGVELDERVIAFLDNALEAIEYTSNINYKIAALTLLVSQLIIYFSATDSIIKDGVMKEGSRKMPTITIMQQANDKIMRTLDQLGVTPLADAKISKLKEKSNKDTDISELMAAITA